MSRIAAVTGVATMAFAASWLPAASAESQTAKRAVYSDATGEVAQGPDITTAEVSSDEGTLSFRVAIPSHPILTDDMRIRIWLDADDDPETGLIVEGREGLDLFLLVERWELGFGAVGVYRCSASTCTGRREASVGFTFDSGATFAFDPTPLGIARIERFRFSVEATAGRFDQAARRYDFSDARQDVAPAEGRYWSYDTRTAVVHRFSATPTRPVAGKPFALRLQAVRTDSGLAVTRGNVSCSCRIAGKPIRPGSQRFFGGTAVCTFDIPATARGKRFRSSISLRAPGIDLARSVSGTIR
jgi:hypothetical protein